MSGGARNEKQRQQRARADRLAAAGIVVPPSKFEQNRTAIIAAAVALVVLVVGGFGLVYLLNRPVTATYSTTASGAIVTAGSGPAVIDIYEDFLCPGCQALESRDGKALTTALNEGRITVRYHLLGLLDNRTDPAGYSTRAADAALCAADAGIFGAFHQRLYADQPAVNSAGLTDDQLVEIGTDLGAGPDFATCVRGTTHDDAIAEATDGAKDDAALRNEQGTFGTPTVTTGGTRVDINSSSWLTDAGA